MGIFNENAIIGTSAAGGAEYDIDNSCRFHASQEQRLTKTPGSAGNQKTWTVSFWFKKTTIGGASASEFVFSANSATEIYWSSSTKKFGI